MDLEELQVQHKTEMMFKPKTSEKEPVSIFTTLSCDCALVKTGWAHNSEQTKGANCPPSSTEPLYTTRPEPPPNLRAPKN
jgi:hypothetical protein